MRNDEFNKIEITNDKQIRGLEFGKTQDSETISQKENKLPEGELNEKYVGKTIRKQTEVNVQYANKATAPVHGSATVTSTTTASNIAATATTVVTAASVVAVTAVAVGTGISVALHDYDYEFNSFVVTSDSLTYELYVVDHKNERPDGEPYEEYDHPNEEDINEEDIKEPFTLRVYNDNYDYSIPTWLYSNYGEFNNLKANESYHIVLSENRFGGETIFDEVFKTKETDPVSEFRGITWDKKCNFLTNTMTVQLDYQDDLDKFSDFKFNLEAELVTATGHLSFTYDLKKTTEVQEIKLDIYPEFELSLVYNYSFTYKDNGEEVTYDQGSFQFEDNSGAVSEFHKFVFDKTANFKERTFDVQLDFVDDFNVYSDFVLSFIYIFDEPISSDQPEDEFTVDVPLTKTTEVQTISLDGVEISLSDSYKYRLTCLYYGEKTTLDEGDVTFTDNSGAIVKFNEFIFDETINYDTREITLQLDYTDELGYLYGFEFILTDLETEEERSFGLVQTTDAQTIEVNEIKEYDDDNNPVYFIDPVKHRVKYSLKYWKMDEEIYVIQDKECKFKNSLVSTFTGLDTPYDFALENEYDTYILPIRFIFDDAAHVYSGFEVAFYKNDELYGRLAFEGETVHDHWMNGVFTGMEGHGVDELVNTPIKVTVSSYVIDDDNPGGVLTEIYSETATFTLDQKVEFYGIDLLDSPEEPATIISGDYQICFMPIFSGATNLFEIFLEIECQTGNTYKIPFYLGNKNQLVYANLTYCSNFFEENFATDFSNPVKISIKYITYHYEMLPGDSTTEPHEGLVADGEEKTLLIAENYQFMISA